VRTLPPGVSKVDVRACDVIFSKDLRFLYAANRVHEDFVVYAIHPENGALLEVQRVANPGKEARHIAIDPTGRYFLSANQMTNEVLIFPIDVETGFLQPTVSGAAVKSPSCILFG
jgi:6-phosphogluconolactonase